MTWLSRLSLAAMALFVLACGAAPATTPMTIELLTSNEAGDACMDALAQGTLVPNTGSGLGLRAPNGELTSVVWPMGYSATWSDGIITLFDRTGAAIAQQGDTVQMGGGHGLGGHFYACAGTVERVSLF